MNITVRSNAGWRAAVLVLVLGAACACGRAVPPVAALAEGDTVLAFGDSLTYGTGADAHEAYPVVLAELIGRRVVASGVPGDVTADGLRRLPDALDAVQPTLLLLCMGGNDMLRRIDSAETAANLRDMVRLARARGVAVVLIGLPKPPLFPGSVAYYADIASEFDLPFEDEILRTLLYDARTRSDAVHPNAAGYRKMAESIADLLRAAGAVQ